MRVHNLNSHPLNSLDQSKDPWGLSQNASFKKGRSHFMYFVQVAPDLAMWVYISLFLLTTGIDLVTYINYVSPSLIYMCMGAEGKC